MKKKITLSKLLEKDLTASRLFHQKTKIKEFPKIDLDPKEWPASWKRVHFKEYPRFEQIKLPTKFKDPAPKFSTVLLNRRSSREFKIGSINLVMLSKLLFFSAGVNHLEEGIKFSKRTYPSAGARYPLELYLVLFRPIGRLEQGIYHYNVKRHSLELIGLGDYKNELMKICGQGWIKEALLIILISAVFDRTQTKYGERGYRYVLLDAGHLAQNIYLTSTALRLGCCAIGGFIDDQANSLLDLDGIKESVIYLAAIGVI